MILKNKFSGERVHVTFGYNFWFVLFGPLVAFKHKNWAVAFIWLIVVFVLAAVLNNSFYVLLAQAIGAIFYNTDRVKRLVSKGFQPMTEEDREILFMHNIHTV